MTKPDWTLQKSPQGGYETLDGRFRVFPVMKGKKYDRWTLLDTQSGRREDFSTKKSCKDALRARYPYWK